MENTEFKPYKTDPIMGDYYKHPTFGIMSICRTSGGVSTLFGSSIKHNNTIRIEISHAELCRNLNRDVIFDREKIVEIEMSPTQFADAITGLNIGCGIPVTIKWIGKSEGENLIHTEPPYQNKVEQFNDEFEVTMKDLAKRFDTLIELANESHAQKRLIREIELLKQSYAGHAPFITRQFSEQMEKTITEAKGEVEAFVTHAVQSYGLEAIRNQAPQIVETQNIKQIEPPKTWDKSDDQQLFQ
jgi:16S rRNA G966 N2-methylase RsmD